MSAIQVCRLATTGHISDEKAVIWLALLGIMKSDALHMLVAMRGW